MRFLPELRVFGYTAHDGDEIAVELAKVASEFPDRWFIRTSHTDPAPGRAIVVEDDPRIEDVIVCPAQDDKTDCCSTCALCWSPAAWDKTIAFKRHGMLKGRKAPGNHRPGGRGKSVKRDELGLTPKEREVYDWMRAQADERGVLSASASDIDRGVASARGNWTNVIKPLLASRLVQMLQRGRGKGHPTWWRVFDAPQDEFPPPPALPLPAKKARAPRHVGYEKPASSKAAPLAPRKPDEPLMKRERRGNEPAPAFRAEGSKFKPAPVKAKFHPKTGALLNPSVIGSAERLAIGTPEERISSVPETELERIQRMYGAVVKKAPAE